MADVDVRRFERGDGPAVRSLHERAMRDAGDFAEDAPDPDLDDVRGHYLENDGEFLVAVSDGAVVGMVAYHPAAEWFLADRFAFDRETAELTRMRVEPDHQRRGIGGTLAAELERRAREDGYEQLVLDVGEDNDGARAFYESRGFEFLRTETLSGFGEGFRLATYRKRL